VVTADGCRLITKFPAEELLVTGTIYVRGADLASASGAARTDGNGVRADPGMSPGY
jgi:hypothetical protein